LFHKTVCFCFARQTLDPGESQTMPVKFVVDRRLPHAQTTLALDYVLYELRPGATPLEDPSAGR
jgi:cytochrome c oxidase assembly protein subunit 11